MECIWNIYQYMENLRIFIYIYIHLCGRSMEYPWNMYIYIYIYVYVIPMEYIQCGAPVFVNAKLVHITPMSLWFMMVYGTQRTNQLLGFTNQLVTFGGGGGPPHCMEGLYMENLWNIYGISIEYVYIYIYIHMECRQNMLLTINRQLSLIISV